ncbi:HAD-IIB family hydrolase [Psychromarinibacter sp. C21-152]|uniref:HAD-IIB family hydrolase n=1 Tax=Psychromarinibacter sediminicola TaxID=3033385 RepID=A0AAE3TBI6_9RHOB|nr:HAD-IIB family hydrolase [Psychromarinibacter sediminicola]MDF0603069.1 HAD-IIB family hydrolase [Psychromarinibacter sediminicola]
MSAAATRPWLWVSDIDDTLTGDAAAMEALAAALDRDRGRVWFAVNSSRPADSVRETLAREFPPDLAPDYRITALGTEVYRGDTPLPGWQDRFAGWPQAEIYAALQVLGHRPHAAAYQTPYKVSFAVPKYAQDAARQALSEFPCQIIASGTDDFDVIPPAAGKGAATLHLAEHLGLTPQNVVVSGDSGNDLAMFRVAPSGIAVGNARPELIRALPEGTFYHARAGHAGGVLEGLRYYGVLPTGEEPG